MQTIPLSQLKPEQIANFDRSHTGQWLDMATLNQFVSQAKISIASQYTAEQEFEFGPIVIGEPTAVTDDFDVTLYYRLKPNEPAQSLVSNPEQKT